MDVRCAAFKPYLPQLRCLEAAPMPRLSRRISRSRPGSTIGDTEVASWPAPTSHEVVMTPGLMWSLALIEGGICSRFEVEAAGSKTSRPTRSEGLDEIRDDTLSDDESAASLTVRQFKKTISHV
jgi:hypothetical protein